MLTESLRKYPPAAIHVRFVSEAYECIEANMRLPKGMMIVIPVYAIHHDPEHYEQPEEFLPERFSPEETKKRPSCTFIPFGDGPRNCIASRFGMMQTKIGLAMLLKHFKFAACDRTPPMPMHFSPSKPILSPPDGLWLNIEAM